MKRREKKHSKVKVKTVNKNVFAESSYSDVFCDDSSDISDELAKEPEYEINLNDCYCEIPI